MDNKSGLKDRLDLAVAVITIIAAFGVNLANLPDVVKYIALGVAIAVLGFVLWQRFTKPASPTDKPNPPNSGGVSAGHDLNNQGGVIVGGNARDINSGNTTVNTGGGGYAGRDLTDNRTTNNVGRDQYTSGNDMFIGNRNVSTGGDINDYGGVQGGVHNYGGVTGNVNSGGGSQSNISAGNISGNSGNIAVGSGIRQSYAAGGQTGSSAAALLSALEDLRDQIDSKLVGNDTQRLSVRNPLTTAIKSLRGGQIDSTVVTPALKQAANALASLNMGNERDTLRSAAAAAGLSIS